MRPTARGSAASWHGRESGACRVKSCDCIGSSRAAAALPGRSSPLRLLRRPRRSEFQGSAFAGVPESPDLNWLRSCVDFLVRRDA